MKEAKNHREYSPEFVPMNFSVMLKYMILKEKRAKIHDHLEKNEGVEESDTVVRKFKKLFEMPLPTDEAVEDKKHHKRRKEPRGSASTSSSEESDDSEEFNEVEVAKTSRTVSPEGYHSAKPSMAMSAIGSPKEVHKSLQQKMKSQIDRLILQARHNGKKTAQAHIYQRHPGALANRSKRSASGSRHLSHQSTLKRSTEGGISDGDGHTFIRKESSELLNGQLVMPQSKSAKSSPLDKFTPVSIARKDKLPHRGLLNTNTHIRLVGGDAVNTATVVTDGNNGHGEHKIAHGGAMSSSGQNFKVQSMENSPNLSPGHIVRKEKSHSLKKTSTDLHQPNHHLTFTDGFVGHTLSDSHMSPGFRITTTTLLSPHAIHNSGSMSFGKRSESKSTSLKSVKRSSVQDFQKVNKKIFGISTKSKGSHLLRSNSNAHASRQDKKRKYHKSSENVPKYATSNLLSLHSRNTVTSILGFPGSTKHATTSEEKFVDKYRKNTSNDLDWKLHEDVMSHRSLNSHSGHPQITQIRFRSFHDKMELHGLQSRKQKLVKGGSIPASPGIKTRQISMKIPKTQHSIAQHKGHPEIIKMKSLQFNDDWK